MADQSIKYVITGDDSAMAAALRRVQTSLQAVDRQTVGMFGGIESAFGRVNGVMLSLTALLGAGGFAAGIQLAIDLQDQMYKSAQKAGVSTQVFSEYVYAAKLADVETEQLTKAFGKLSSTLSDAKDGQKEAVELFRRLKLDPANVKDADALLQELADRFEKLPDGARKTALAIDIFGERVGPGLIPFLNQGKQGLAQLREEARALGVTVSDEAGAAAEQFNDNLTRLKQASIGASNEIAKDLVPSLIQASDYFVKATREAGLLQGTLISIGALFAKVLGIDEKGKLQDHIQELGTEAERLQGMLIGVENVLKREPDNATAQRRFGLLTKKLQELNAEIAKAKAELAELDRPPAPAAKPKGGGDANAVLAKQPPPPKAVSEPSQMVRYEQMLAEEQRITSILTRGHEYRKQQELEFWRFMVQTQEMSAADRAAVLKKMALLEVDIARQAYKQRDALEKQSAQTAEQLALAKLDREAQGARGAYELGQITHAQLAELELGFEQRRYEIRAAALQGRLALAAQDPDLNPIEAQRIKDELLLLEEQHQGKMQELKLRQPKFENPLAGAESAFTNSINALLSRTQTLSQAMRGLWQGISSSVIGEITKIMVKKAAAWAAEKAEALATIGTNAGKAASGAAASQAGIPIVGPVLALAAMGTVLAAVMGLKSNVSSAARGFDIPAGVNPLTQLHEREMVLPAAYADVIRGLAADGPRSSSGSLEVTVKAAPMGGDFYMITRRELVAALKSARRDFEL